jgi:hypothetical protein
VCFFLLLWVCTTSLAQTSQNKSTKQQALWEKLEANIVEVDHNLDGVLAKVHPARRRSFPAGQFN